MKDTKNADANFIKKLEKKYESVVDPEEKHAKIWIDRYMYNERKAMEHRVQADVPNVDSIKQLCEYGTETPDEVVVEQKDEPVSEQPTPSVKEIGAPPPSRTKHCHYFIMGNCRRGTSCNLLHDVKVL